MNAYLLLEAKETKILVKQIVKLESREGMFTCKMGVLTELFKNVSIFAPSSSYNAANSSVLKIVQCALPCATLANGTTGNAS